jgi:Ca-activated chloride channel homolog
MHLDLTHPHWLWLAVPTLGWTVWWFWKSDAQIGGLRRWCALAVRLLIVVLILYALAGLQWLKPLEGMNVFFLLDRSDSVPIYQQEMASELASRMAVGKQERDKAGLVVFGTDAAVDFLPAETVRSFKPQAVVASERTDIASAIRLAAAAFPENGQRRLVLATDGNENLEDALVALHSVRPLEVTLDVLPLGVASKNDVSMQRLALPSAAKKGQTFDVHLFVSADRAGPARLRLYRSDQLLGEQSVELNAGKNLLSFPQTLTEPGFYTYEAQIEAKGDLVPQNNQATGFAFIRGEPRALLVSSDPKGDTELVEALREAKVQVRAGGPNIFPGTLAELQSYDTVFISNVAAGDIGLDRLRLLESAVRDFGVGLVVIGGDQAFAAGAYRGTPLEEALPVSMELNSKKVLPSGALALVIDKSGSMTAEKIEMVKQAAMAAVDALGPMDYVGVIAFDGQTWIVSDMQQAKDKKDILRRISGITAGGGTVMYPPMTHAFKMLKDVRASIKHCVVLTDGVSQPGEFLGLCRAMRDERITVSTVGVGYDMDRSLLGSMADIGGGRYYDVIVPSDIPNIFIKEVAVILKSAIFEEPFKPQVAAASELTRGLGGDFPTLYGYVCTTPKSRAEIPLITEKGDPLLAH